MRGRGLKQEELLQTAIRVIRQHGYRDTSLQDIANEFQFTKPALYYYIRSKEELLYKIYDETITQALETLHTLIAEAAPPAERLRRVVSYFFELCMREDAMAIFFSEKSNLTPEHFEAITAKEREVVHLIRQLIEDGIQAGEWRLVDATAITFAILGMGAWTVHWFSPDGPLGQAELIEVYWDFIQRGMRPQNEGQH